MSLERSLRAIIGSKLRELLVCLVVVALPQGLIGVGGLSAQVSAPLQLEEARSLVLPDTLDVIGVAPLSDGSVWLWTRSAGVIYKWAAGQRALSTFRFEGRVISAASTAVSGEVEVVEGLRPSIAVVSEQGLRARRSLPLVLAIDAIRDGLAWLIIGTDSSGKMRLLHCGGHSCQRLHVSLPENRLKEHLTRLARVGSSAVLMDVDDPFGFVSFSGSPYASGTSREIRFLLASVQRNGRWIALNPITVGTESILEFADLRSDSRVLVAVDKHAQVLRHTVLDVPLGFMATQPHRQTVIAARRGAQLELVEYRYTR